MAIEQQRGVRAQGAERGMEAVEGQYFGTVFLTANAVAFYA